MGKFAYRNATYLRNLTLTEYNAEYSNELFNKKLYLPEKD